MFRVGKVDHLCPPLGQGRVIGPSSFIVLSDDGL